MSLLPLKLVKPRPPATAKEAFARLIAAAGGFGPAAMTAGMRVSSTTLFKYSDHADENRDRHPPVDVVEVLERACGQPMVTEYLARVTGHELLKVHFAGGDPLLDEDMARVGQRFGALFQAYAEALADDGLVTKAEAGRLISDMDNLLRQALHARSRLVEKYREE